MIRVFMVLVMGLFLSGCAAIAPLALLSHPSGGAPPVQVHEETRVSLARDNFTLVKTNVWGQSRGFSLLGFITIYPATLNKAMKRMYGAAEMQPGQPQTMAHLIIEQSSSYLILFAIPKIEVRADVVEFNPQVRWAESEKQGQNPGEEKK